MSKVDKDTNVPNTDTISRQAAIETAIDAADDWDGGMNSERARIIGKALLDLPSAQPEQCYGYSLKSLIVFAIACRRAGVENEDLKQFAYNCEFAWKTMQEEFENNIKCAIQLNIDMIEGEKDETN